MARETIEYLIDDLTGEQEAVEHRFVDLTGTEYVIDLAEASKTRLDRAQQAYQKALAPFLAKARPTASRPVRKRRSEVSAPAVRAWAAQRGIEVPPRGRIKTEIIEQYLVGK